jgi:asparagine synthase (glutamine-hydrolysing)
MGGFCGWIAIPPDAARAEAVLAGMQTTDCVHDGGGAESTVAGTSAIAICSGIVPVVAHRSGALLAATEGRMHWTLPELATLAARHGPAATLIEAYRRYGADCLRHIGGSFAIAVIDAESASGLLAVDRMGIRPLCYASPAVGLVCGSSADNVAAHPAVGRTLSRQAIFDYLYCHVVPAPGTIYQTILKLRPAEYVVFRKGAVERRFYWQLPYRDDATESVDAMKLRFRRLLREAAGRAVDSDTEIGAFLSGGTDSSTVAGLLTELRGKPAKTYSIGFAAKGFDEMSYARITPGTLVPMRTSTT